MEGWVNLGVGYIPRWFTCPQTVTHRSSSWARRGNENYPCFTYRLSSRTVSKMISFDRCSEGWSYCSVYVTHFLRHPVVVMQVLMCRLHAGYGCVKRSRDWFISCPDLHWLVDAWCWSRTNLHGCDHNDCPSFHSVTYLRHVKDKCGTNLAKLLANYWTPNIEDIPRLRGKTFVLHFYLTCNIGVVYLLIFIYLFVHYANEAQTRNIITEIHVNTKTSKTSKKYREIN